MCVHVCVCVYVYVCALVHFHIIMVCHSLEELLNAVYPSNYNLLPSTFSLVLLEVALVEEVSKENQVRAIDEEP